MQTKASNEKDYETIVGVVYDPFCDELWTAIKGGPAGLTEKRINVSRRGKLREKVDFIGFAKSAGLDLSLPYFNKLVLARAQSPHHGRGWPRYYQRRHGPLRR